MVDRRIVKIRALAERGATEGERAAARAALKRLEVKETVAEPDLVAATRRMSEAFSKMGIAVEEAIAQVLKNNPEWYKQYADAPVKSKKPSHHGRVTFDV